MIASTRRWLRRNRTNFAIGAGVLGAGYLAGQYILGKVSEARQRMSDDRIAKENLRRRFEQNQEDCTFTILAILPTATENILEALPVEQTLSELQKQKAERLSRISESYVHASQIGDSSSGNGEGGGDGVPQASSRQKKTKLQLWNEMKISSIARAFTLIYTLSLLTLLTRIQLNLLGRRNYLASVVSLASPPTHESRINLENNDDDNFEHAYGNDFETNRRYLSFSWWLLHRGCLDIMDKVTTAVKEVFGRIDPREEITLEKLSELTLEVRKKVEGGTDEQRRTCKWLPYLLPGPDQEDYVLQESGMATASTTTPASPSLRRLLDETSDLIDSPAFTHVLTLLLDSAFSLLIDNKIAALSYKIPPTSASTARVQEIVGADAKAKVANSLAVFCRQAHSIGSGMSNEYLAAMENVRDLEAFAAVVYSSNFEFETPEASAGDLGVDRSKFSRPSTAGAADKSSDSEGADGETTFVNAESGFESAWGKALAKEDGKKN